ncbi:5-oxoprolinase subunit C family protein [Aquimarina penaris]|uniref:5-oxoprolinase subunit C family protein n=1 Tax=Aquimarina penaris TaxID=3231044 RepID=UPI0034619EFE
MMGKVTIVKPGFFATVQDKGRFGFSKYGVPKSGAMDQLSFAMANLLLDNEENDACIEFAFQDLVVEFSEDTVIVITGAAMHISLNGRKKDMYRRIKVCKNDVLEFKYDKTGMYTYLGIEGGFLTPVVLKSRSFYAPITKESVLKKGDELPYMINEMHNDQFSNISKPLWLDNSNIVEVYTGPEYALLSQEQKSMLLSIDFTISNTVSRMAMQLVEKLPNDLPSMLTSPVLPGTIQLTPSGGLIVLMRDCQTTGGYPRVLQLNQTSINTMAQKRVGEKIQFKLLEEK